LIIAQHLPKDDAELYQHCEAGWTAMKADTAHFPSPPSGPAMDTALANLAAALKDEPNGGPTETAAVKAAATAVRDLWGQIAKYAQTVLRTLPVEQVPPILADVLLYQSQAGKHGPKPPLAAKHGATSGTAIVTALAILNALTYGFEQSVDQVTWATTTSSKTRVTIGGLTPGKTYWFRVRAFLRDGTMTDYVGPVDLIVV
jgi:hypothetical protein